MSKVDTLLKLIVYQKQHPQASDEEIAQAIGISQRHVRRCNKEVNLFRNQLSEATLEPSEIRFLMSLLNQYDPLHKRIYQQLQSQLGFSTRDAYASHAPTRTPLRDGSIWGESFRTTKVL